MMMRRPPSATLRRRGGISVAALFPLLLLAVFASSLLATLSVTRTLTSWILERRIATVKSATRLRGGGFVDGVATPDAAGLLGSHLALFDDDGGEEEEEEEEEGDRQQRPASAPSPPPPASAACAPMEHTE